MNQTKSCNSISQSQIQILKLFLIQIKLNNWQRDGGVKGAYTHHADLPLSACRFMVRFVGGGLVRGLSAHRVLEGVATEGHALARIVVLVAALLIHEQLVALTGGVAGGLGGVRLGVRRRLRRGRLLAGVSLSRFLLVSSSSCFLFRFLF